MVQWWMILNAVQHVRELLGELFFSVSSWWHNLLGLCNVFWCFLTGVGFGHCNPLTINHIWTFCCHILFQDLVKISNTELNLMYCLDWEKVDWPRWSHNPGVYYHLVVMQSPCSCQRKEVAGKKGQMSMNPALCNCEKITYGSVILLTCQLGIDWPEWICKLWKKGHIPAVCLMALHNSWWLHKYSGPEIMGCAWEVTICLWGVCNVGKNILRLPRKKYNNLHQRHLKRGWVFGAFSIWLYSVWLYPLNEQYIEYHVVLKRTMYWIQCCPV